MDGRQRVIWNYDVGVDIKVNPRTSPLKIKSSIEKLTGYGPITLIYFTQFGYKQIRIIQNEYNGLLDLWYLERC